MTFIYTCFILDKLHEEASKLEEEKGRKQVHQNFYHDYISISMRRVGIRRVGRKACSRKRIY